MLTRFQPRRFGELIFKLLCNLKQNALVMDEEVYGVPRR